MSKKFTFLFRVFCALMILISLPRQGWGQEKGEPSYTITFATGSSDGTAASTSTACSTIVSAGSTYLSGNLVTATNVYYGGASGLKLGKSNNGAGNLKMNLSTSGQAYATTVVVSAKRYNTSKSATLSVNGGTNQTISNSTEFNNYTFTLNNDITYLQLQSSQYIWVASVTVYYTTYTVVYNANDANATGSTTDSNSPYKKGATVTVLDCGFSNPGKTFDGWYTNPSYTGTKYEAGDTYNSIADDVTFYAKWASAGPTLSVEPEEAELFTYSHGNGPSTSQGFAVTGTNLSAGITVSVSSTNNVFEISDDDITFGTTNLTLDDGDIFTVHLKSGLNIDSYSGTVTISSTGADPVEIELSGSVTGYTVTYYGNDNTSGTVPTDLTAYTKGATVTVLGNTGSLAKTGYTFAHWNTAPGGNGTSYGGDETFEISANTSLYAQWTIISSAYTLTKTGETTHAEAKLQKYVDNEWSDVGENPIPYNTRVRVVTTPDDGYACTVTVKDSGDNTIAVDANNEFDMPASAITVTVNVTPYYTVAKAAGLSHGDVSFSPASATPGDLITVTATPDDGYVLDEWNVYKTGESTTKVVVEDGHFTMPSYNVTVGATFRTPLTMTVDFESTTSAYTNWVFTNMTSQKNTITAHGGSYYGNTDGKATASIHTKNKIANPLSFSCYISKESNNTTASTWYIQTSSDGSSWDDVETHSATSMNKGAWVQFNADLSDYSNVYVRIYYGSNTAIRAIDDIVLTYAPAPKYNMSVTSTDNLDITATANATEVSEGGSLSVEQGTTVTLSCTPDENYRLGTWSVYRTTNPETTVSVSEGSFTMPAYTVTITATSAPVRTLTRSVNGSTSPTVYDKDEVVALTAPESGIPTGYEFVGWTANPANTTDDDLITSVTMDDNKTVYAVIKKSNKIILTGDDFGSYDTSEQEVTMQGIKFGRYEVMKNGGIQFHKGDGYFYNKEEIKNLTSVVIDKKSGDPVIVKEGNSTSSITTVLSPTNVGSIYTYTVSSGNGFILLTNTASEATTTVYTSVKYIYSGDETRYTRVYSETTTTASGDITITGKTIIPSGSTLNMNGHELHNTIAANLVIEDGGQLISSYSVAATVKKTITPSDAPTEKGAAWYTISSPVNDAEIALVTNLIVTSPYEYDLYRFNETKDDSDAEHMRWENYKNSAYSSDFTNFENGRGYIYRKNNSDAIAFAGNINVGDIKYTLTKSSVPDLVGFNLIGNPYPHSIAKGSGEAIYHSNLATNYYILSPDDETWQLCEDGEEITAQQGILVQTVEGFELTISDTPFTPAPSKYRNDNIRFSVANEQFEDVAYAWFDKGYGLNKIAHRNPKAPMLYIPQVGKNYATAIMNDDIKVFGLSFKAMTTGKYTISAKALGNFSYIHLIDRLTGEDVDLLLEDYSFIGSPMDSDARFIVKLTYMPSYSTEGNDNFAYQTGSEILVSGEGELQIFDVTGRKVMTTTINGVEAISGLQQGVYIFRVIGETQKTQKIVVR
jgi:hypothetical protein